MSLADHSARLPSRRLATLVMCGLLLSTGCEQKATTTSVPPSEAASPTASSVSEKPDAPTADAQPTRAEDSNVAQTVPPTDAGKSTESETPQPKKEASPAVPAVVSEKPTPPASVPSTVSSDASSKPAVRVALLSESGPILIDLQLELDGRPLGVSFDEILHHVRTSADADRDGKVTWDELTAQRQVKAGLLGNTPLNDERAKLEFIRQYDSNGNQVVDDQEWSLVFRQQSSRGRFFSTENRDDHRDWNRAHSAVLAVLDVDGDRVLSRDECEAAPQRLIKLDADDDERIQTFEVSSSQVEIPGMPARSQRRSSGPYLLWQIGARTDWNQFIRACQNVYASGGPLATGCFAARPGLFAALDGDENGRISLKEIAQLADLAPHVRLRMSWGERSADAKSSASEILSWSEELGPRDAHCLETPDGIVIHDDRVSYSIFPRDLATESPMARATAIIAQFDTNKNAYLDGDEIERGAMQFGATAKDVDTDGNEQITAAEIAEYLRLQTSATIAQVRAVASHPEDAFWAFLDENNDGELDGEEIAHSGRRLLTCDRDGSGTVAAEELSEFAWVALVRGDAPAGLLRPAPRRSAAATEGPAWFRHMDANGDGTLSAREFVGSETQFRRLDANNDGKLQVGELVAPR